MNGDSAYGSATCTAQNTASQAPTYASCTLDGKTVPHNAVLTAWKLVTNSSGQICTAQLRLCSNGVLNGDDSYSKSTCTHVLNSAPAPLASCTLDGKTVPHNGTVAGWKYTTSTAGQLCTSQMRLCSNGVLNGDDSYSKSSCTHIFAPKPEPLASCTLDGKTIPHTGTLVGWKVVTSSSGQTCTPQVRLCTNGVLNGDSAFSKVTCAAALEAASAGTAPTPTPPSTSDPVTSSPCTLDGVTVGHGESRTFYQTPASDGTCASQTRLCNNGQFYGSVSYNKATCTAPVAVPTTAPANCTLDGVTVPHGTAKFFYRYQSVNPGASCAYRNRLCTNGVLSGDAIFQYAACTVKTTTSQVEDGSQASQLASILAALDSLLAWFEGR